MKVKNTKSLIIQNILIFIPFLLYGIYKNGFLIYEKGLINLVSVFKPFFLIIIGIIIKIGIDILMYKKIKIDYNFVYVFLVGMIMPYNINYLIYIITFLISYFLALLAEKKLKLEFNKVCFIYLIIILINSLFNSFNYQNILESNYNYSFTFLDLLMGRNIGGVSSTSIFFSLISYVYLTYSIYYKKDIPFIINLTYLLIIFIYFFITHDNTILLNSELIFASIFVATLPEYSPYKVINQIIYSILIGLIASFISIFFNSIISIYIAIFLVSLLMNIKNIKLKFKKEVVNK